jgi:hypothetical protein
MARKKISRSQEIWNDTHKDSEQSLKTLGHGLQSLASGALDVGRAFYRGFGANHLVTGTYLGARIVSKGSLRRVQAAVGAINDTLVKSYRDRRDVQKQQSYNSRESVYIDSSNTSINESVDSISSDASAVQTRRNVVVDSARIPPLPNTVIEKEREAANGDAVVQAHSPFPLSQGRGIAEQTDPLTVPEEDRRLAEKPRRRYDDESLEFADDAYDVSKDRLNWNLPPTPPDSQSSDREIYDAAISQGENQEWSESCNDEQIERWAEKGYKQVPNTRDQTSGITFARDNIRTHHDSGKQITVYSFDTKTIHDIVREVDRRNNDEGLDFDKIKGPTAFKNQMATAAGLLNITAYHLTDEQGEGWEHGKSLRPKSPEIQTTTPWALRRDSDEYHAEEQRAYNALNSPLPHERPLTPTNRNLRPPSAKRTSDIVTHANMYPQHTQSQNQRGKSARSD